MKLVTSEEMRRMEQAADAAGCTFASMMERAGRAVAAAIRDHFATGRVLVLVGPGNNGGDGLVAARYLHEWGYSVTAYIWKRAQAQDPNLVKVQERALPLFWADQDADFTRLARLVRACDVLVDALLGTGVVGPLRGNLRTLLDVVQRGLHTPHPAWVVAVDLPSGLNADTGEIDELALVADLTVTFANPKRGHVLFPGAAHVGALQVADIGIAPAEAEGLSMELATAEQVADLLPTRPLDAHKGTFGKALVVGGSANYVGAPCLAAEAAYRVGAGLVTLAVAERIYPIVAARLTEATYLVLPDDLGALVPGAVRVLAPAAPGYQALLLGPGLGRESVTRDFVSALLLGATHEPTRALGFEMSQPPPTTPLPLPPLVVDADGLNLLAQWPRWWEHLPADTVLTPHMGEMARLLGTEIKAVATDRLGCAQAAARNWGCTVVLKGAYTIVATPHGGVTVIPYANPTLATAGTGDVLAGTIVGLMAQGLTTYAASVCGAFLHGLAGELHCQHCGPVGMLASDLLPLLPQAISYMTALPQGASGYGHGARTWVVPCGRRAC